MEISQIHSYLVGIGKGEEEQLPVKGTPIELTGNLFEMLRGIFLNADRECIYDIAFQRNEDGDQINECRNLFIDHVRSKDFDSGKLIAARLQSVTTHRSGLGLLFIIVGSNGNKDRIVASRFPADTGVLADEQQTSLNIEFVERIFMKNAKAYKSVLYEGRSYDSDFWRGKTIDKQINSDLTISDYWIREFLLSDFATTGERGTRRLGVALKDAINKGTDVSVKEELIAALKLARGLNGNMVSAESFSNRLGLSENAKNAIRSEMKASLFNEQFQLNMPELDRLMPYRTVEMDSGAFLTAEANNFDEIFQKSEIENGRVSFSTQGKVVDEKVRKSK